MQLNNALLTTLLASTTVLGAVLRPKQATSFSVTGFAASCIPHSLYCNYEFSVITDPVSASPSGNTTPAKCSLMLQGPDNLPAVNLTGCAEVGAYSWAVELTQSGGFTLSVTTPHDSHSNYTGQYPVSADQLVHEQHEASVIQRYTGPSTFAVPISGYA